MSDPTFDRFLFHYYHFLSKFQFDDSEFDTHTTVIVVE